MQNLQLAVHLCKSLHRYLSTIFKLAAFELLVQPSFFNLCAITACIDYSNSNIYGIPLDLSIAFGCTYSHQTRATVYFAQPAAVRCQLSYSNFENNSCCLFLYSYMYIYIRTYMCTHVCISVSAKWPSWLGTGLLCLFYAMLQCSKF